MKKPTGRKIKRQVGRLLEQNSRSSALSQLARIPDEQLKGPLFSYLYSGKELIKFRSVTAMGELALRLAADKMEKARIVLRRIMWNLNDESGGIGWGSPEAMGEILSRSDELASEFKSILFSYLDTGGNYIEHETLQQGVLWGIGTYLEASPSDLTDVVQGQLITFLHDPDIIKRSYATRALINANRFAWDMVPDKLRTDTGPVNIYTGWHFISTRISEMILAGSPAKPPA